MSLLNSSDVLSHPLFKTVQKLYGLRNEALVTVDNTKLDNIAAAAVTATRSAIDYATSGNPIENNAADDFVKSLVLSLLHQINKVRLQNQRVTEELEEKLQTFIKQRRTILAGNTPKLKREKSQERSYPPEKSNSSYSSSHTKKAKRTNYSADILSVLKEWLATHSDNPYPSEDEKLALCEFTGLSQIQINNWFINARRRILPKLDTST